MICLTPKRYLRMAQSRSPIAALSDGEFHSVLDDRAAATLDAAGVTRVVLCSGKVGHELMDRRDSEAAPVAVVRLEQLYPFPEPELVAVLERYPNAAQVWWVQEEPGNMGAWNYARGKLLRISGAHGAALHHIARHKSGSPATGSHTVHEREQDELLAAAMAPS